MGAQCLRDVIRRLGLHDSGTNYVALRKDLERLGIAVQKRPTDDEIRVAVAAASTIADTLRLLGLVPRGGNYAILHRRIKRLGIDTSHFRGAAWRRGLKGALVPQEPLDRILIRGRPVASNGLKKRLLREHVKPRACERCSGTEWRGDPIPLELDHINGDRDDNRLENLRLLCPNCHAATPTFRGRNIRRVK